MKPPVAIFLIATLALGGALAWANWPTEHLPVGTQADRIVVEKERRTLTLYAQGRPLKTYPISLGRVPVGAKEREGDNKTPEGVYHITELKRDSSYHLALRVSYPELYDNERARRRGVSAGSDIMIHGLPNGLGAIGRFQRLRDWTAGCVALTNPEIEELFAVVPLGTVIELVK